MDERNVTIMTQNKQWPDKTLSEGLSYQFGGLVLSGWSRGNKGAICPLRTCLAV